jgi:hypothetical protein
MVIGFQMNMTQTEGSCQIREQVQSEGSCRVP